MRSLSLSIASIAVLAGSAFGQQSVGQSDSSDPAATAAGRQVVDEQSHGWGPLTPRCLACSRFA